MCHPDLFPDDERKKEEFQELQSAYEVLSDVRKRAQMFHQSNPETKEPFSNRPRKRKYATRVNTFGGKNKYVKKCYVSEKKIVLPLT